MLSCPGLHRPEIEFFDSVLVTIVGYYEILGRHAVLKLALSLHPTYAFQIVLS
jgi:hypothetical protein